MIVCHITDGGYEGSISWLCNPKAEASAHFVVAKDGRITQLVDIKDTAWGNGTSVKSDSKVFYGKSTLEVVRDRKTNANYYTISIEHEGMWNESHGKLTDAQLAATIGLIKFIRSEVKRLYKEEIPADREHIVGHYQINPITKPNCPGSAFQFDAIIAALKGTAPAAPAAKPTTPAIKPAVKPAPTLKVGAKVHINKTATKYSTGQAIPATVKAKTYTVQQISAGKALLKEIQSWVNTKDITVIA